MFEMGCRALKASSEMLGKGGKGGLVFEMGCASPLRRAFITGLSEIPY